MAKHRVSHDSGYKYLFSNKKIFYQFITHFVDEKFAKKIKLENIRQVDRSFVSDDFLKRESDIIYKIKTDEKDIYLYILMEFQSTVDKTIPVRMLSYIMQFYDQHIRNSQKAKLPAIFPILLYNGPKKWDVPKNINQLIEQSIPSRYIPSFEYYQFIESKVSQETLEEVKGAMAAIICLEKEKDEKSLKQAVHKVHKLLENEESEEFRMFMVWLNKMFYGVFSEDEIDKISRQKERKSMLAELVQRIEDRGLEQGLEQGKVLGLEQGITTERLKTAQKMLSQGFPDEQIIQLTDLSPEELKTLQSQSRK